MKSVAIFYFSAMLALGSNAFGGCNKTSNTSGGTITPVTPIDTTTTVANKKYLALGDSYTIGQSVAANERFAAQTVELLKANGIKINDPQYIATTGWTTDNLIAAIQNNNPQGPYDVVSLLIGVNDQYQRHDTTGYRAKFTQLLLTSIQLAGNRRDRVFVLSIPDYSATPFGQNGNPSITAMEIAWFNSINKNVTDSYNIAYVNITPSTQQATSDPTLVANDGLHPSGKEYKKWADMLYPLVYNVLK